MPPITGTVILFIWSKVYISPDSNSDCLAQHQRSRYFAAVYRKYCHGLESCLVRPHGFDVYECMDIRADMVVFTSEYQTAALVGIGRVSPANGSGWHQPSNQRFFRDW